MFHQPVQIYHGSHLTYYLKNLGPLRYLAFASLHCTSQGPPTCVVAVFAWRYCATRHEYSHAPYFASVLLKCHVLLVISHYHHHHHYRHYTLQPRYTAQQSERKMRALNLSMLGSSAWALYSDRYGFEATLVFRHMFLTCLRLKQYRSTGSANATSTTAVKSNCTTGILQGASLNLSPICTHYKRVTTYTNYMDCRGCALRTIQLAPGPVRICNSTVSKAVVTEVVTKCALSTSI